MNLPYQIYLLRQRQKHYLHSEAALNPVLPKDCIGLQILDYREPAHSSAHSALPIGIRRRIRLAQ